MSKIIILFCPPLSLFSEAPKDQSNCELYDCPSCGEKMWMSYKKKTIRDYATELKTDYICECYICFEKRVKDDPELLAMHKVYNI